MRIAAPGDEPLDRQRTGARPGTTSRRRKILASAIEWLLVTGQHPPVGLQQVRCAAHRHIRAPWAAAGISHLMAGKGLWPPQPRPRMTLDLSPPRYRDAKPAHRQGGLSCAVFVKVHGQVVMHADCICMHRLAIRLQAQGMLPDRHAGLARVKRVSLVTRLVAGPATVNRV